MESGQFNKLMKMSSLGDLPNEIMINILLRLPVKSICCFKCTSKPWKALLSCTKFAELHLAFVHAGDNECLLLRSIWPKEARVRSGGGGESSIGLQEVFSLRSKETPAEVFLEVKVPFGSKTGYYTVIGSCNGIVCLSESSLEGLVPLLNIFLWNPTTMEFRMLPRQLVNRCLGIWNMVSFGFLFEPEMMDYHVVRISYITERKSFGVEVYSLRTDQWRVIEADLKCYYHFQHTLLPVFMNRALHWLVAECKHINELEHYVLSFDVKEDKFTKVRLPEGRVRDEFLLHKTRLNGLNSPGESLSLIHCKPFQSYDMWVLKEYGKAESWAKLYSVRLTGKPMKPLLVLDENRILMERKRDGLVVLCDSNFRVVKELRVFMPVRIVKHIETFVSPHQGNESSRHRYGVIPGNPPMLV